VAASLRLALLLLPALSAAAENVSLLEAISRTLKQHPRLEVEREQVRIAQAAQLLSAGIFDTVFTAGAQQVRSNTPLAGLTRLQVEQGGLGGGSQATNSSTAGGGFSKLLRNGIQLSSSVSLARTTDNIVQRQGVNLSQVRFQLVLPLQRGRGREIVPAEETAAEIGTQAARLELNHTAASLIADTAARYWEAGAAKQNLEVLREAEERGALLVNNVRTLVDADRLPRAEMQQVQANLAGRAANRAAGEQRLVEALQALALALGTPVEELGRELDTPDPLPDGETATLPSMDNAAIDSWVRVALTRRADYLGLQKLQGAFDTRRQAAADGFRPQLDLRVGSGYSGLKEGRNPAQWLASPFGNVGGVDLTAAVEYSFPIHHSTARGQLEKATAQQRQNRLEAADLGRTIASGVQTGIGAYKASVIRVQRAREAVDASQAALDGEREKLRLGVGSVVDLLTVEDRLNSARAGLVEARLNFAVLLTRLRFATGTIVIPDQPAQTVQRDIFYRPPWEDPGA